MSVRESLSEFGFPPEKIDLAISACGENLEQAIEWLIAHAESTAEGNGVASAEDAVSETSKESNAEETSSEEKGVKSFKCDDCGKLFKSSEEVEFHAVKSGHASFSESTEEKKALTEEERQLKLKELEEKLSQRRKEKEEEERKERLEREKKRIQMGKDMVETKRKMQEQEIMRLAEERKREKIEDKLARQRVKEQIERDRQERKEASLAATAPLKTQSNLGATLPSNPPADNSQVIKKSYDVTRLQIRLPSGPPIVQEFHAKEPLSAVRLWISLNRKDNPPEGSSQTFNLSTTYPRKVFDEDDMDKPLVSLGLVPSAVLVVMNK